jgi:hypothetical protein
MAAELKYKESYVSVAFAMALLGATDKDLAQHWKVSQKTINAWKRDYPKFMEALTTGKEEADGRVSASLFQRALGYSHRAVKIFMHQGKTLEHEYIERYPPDTTACIFWLKNRQPKLWRDRVENVISGGDRMDEVLKALKYAEVNQGEGGE